ncbi:DUF1177 domain-containing protein [Proteiniclasticum sp. SCR006]|uniref:DUF1177 domain-containing protein n=1 Tax=Proteiniclasticum aestuarii TaxID=2817862 RepID=A0A939HB03_9CLOT|nr:DUF1177 domain-containing protein [Proteiniclasticum aestuarii]MBO1265143.1 DUF1177 domain-containing protein [Proteiniclasticum aestuarii]
MLMKQILEVYDILDSPSASGEAVRDYLLSVKPDADVETYKLEGPKGSTDMLKVRVPGRNGKSGGGTAPTIGLLGRLGGLGARPEQIGFVSDGDGALAAIAVAAKLLDMQKKGDLLDGDVFISTHICPDAPTEPHKPVPFMGSPVEMAQVNKEEVSPELDAVLSVDTTKGNRVINTNGFAISPTVKSGYILKVSEDLLSIMQTTTGCLPHVFPLSTQDITPYGNELYHLNSILQPATATEAPVVGVAITTEMMVAGSATGASHFGHCESAARFMLEVAKYYGRGEVHFYDASEFERIEKLYGSMKHLQTLGKDVS